MPESRILVAVSTPWASDKLFVPVRDLAERLHASVVVAHVVRGDDNDAGEEEPRVRGRQAIAFLTDRLTRAGIPTEGVMLFGSDVARAISNAAEAHKATMIVMGFGVKGAMSRLLGGDLSVQLLKISPVPVLLHPPQWTGTV